MGWWRRLLGTEKTQVDPFALVSRRDGGLESVILASPSEARTTASGVVVSEEGALRNSAVLACVRILANSVAMLPLPVYRRLSPRGKERAPSHPLYAILQEQSNPEMTAFELRRWLMQSVLLWGNGYAEIEWSAQGEVAALWPLQPQMVQVERRGVSLVYRCTLASGRVVELPAWKVLHVATLGVPPEEAQFLETRKFQVTEIARAFGVPPHLVGDMERATFSNIEHQYMEFLQFSLGPYLKQIEQVIHTSLMTREERKVYFVEHLRDSILQADTITRYQAHALGRQWGWLSVNDIRALENMNPVDGGDEYLVPLNMASANEETEQPDAKAQSEKERDAKEKQLQEQQEQN